MLLSSKFLTESTGENIVKKVNIYRRYGQSAIVYFFGPPVYLYAGLSVWLYCYWCLQI